MQYDLFGVPITKPQEIVNVASVKQLSPFRYPGGKTWLVPQIYKWLRSLNTKPQLFVEPFAGGGIISLTVADADLADQIVMVELDVEIAAVWKTIFYGDYEWLINRIVSFDMTVDNVNNLLAMPCNSVEDMAFRTIVKNRTFHGGILAKGTGLIKYGENGKGVNSRWYPQTLAKRIQHIQQIKDKIIFIEGDGLEIIRKNISTAVFFLDPPYTAGGKNAGNRLYNYHTLNHQLLFQLCDEMNDFLMTYDISTEIEQMALNYHFDIDKIAMKNTHNAKMQEYVISNNLNWLLENGKTVKQAERRITRLSINR